MPWMQDVIVVAEHRVAAGKVDWDNVAVILAGLFYEVFLPFKVCDFTFDES